MMPLQKGVCHHLDLVRLRRGAVVRGQPDGHDHEAEAAHADSERGGDADPGRDIPRRGGRGGRHRLHGGVAPGLDAERAHRHRHFFER